MSVIWFFTLGVVPMVVALQARSSRLWATYSLLSGVAVLVFITAAALVAVELERIVSPDAPMGVLQRTSVVAGFAWLAAFFMGAPEGQHHVNSPAVLARSLALRQDQR